MKYRFPLLALCVLSLVVLPLIGQNSPPDSSPPVTTAAPPAPVTNENPPPTANVPLERPAFNDTAVPTRSSTEIYLSLGVLLFGLVVVIGMLWAILRRMEIKQTSDLVDALKLPVVVVIIVSGIFLVTAGYGNEQIAPIIGLMGTIAGYLMGRNGK